MTVDTYIERGHPDHLAWTPSQGGHFWKCLCGFTGNRREMEEHVDEEGEG